MSIGDNWAEFVNNEPIFYCIRAFFRESIVHLRCLPSANDALRFRKSQEASIRRSRCDLNCAPLRSPKVSKAATFPAPGNRKSSHT